MAIITWANKLIDVQKLIHYNPVKEHHEVLEPLSCMIRLAMLYYKDVGTKISISNNRIFFQPPNILQGTLRWKNGDTRLDIHNLYTTITKALKWYDIEDENIKYIFQIAKKGLEKLNKCYNDTSNITSHSLVYYIDNIDKALLNQDVKLTEIDDIYYSPFFKLWSSGQIKCINLLLQELDIVSDAYETETLLATIEKLLSYKDFCVVNIVNKFSTSV